MPVLKYPIGILTLFLALGIIAGHYMALAPYVIYSVCLFGFALLAIAFQDSKRSLLPRPYFTIAVLIFSVCLGMLTQTLHYAPNQKLHYSHLAYRENPVIEGTIAERLKPNVYSERYYFEITSINNSSAKGKILLSADRKKHKKLFHAGDVLIIADSLTPITKPSNPYQFDYANYMAKQGIFDQVRLSDNYIENGVIKDFNYYIGRLREKLAGSFAVHHFKPAIQNTLNALLLGQRQDMDIETNDAYKNAGVLHILAISGLHFSVLFYLLTIIFRPLGRFTRYGNLLRLMAILSLIWAFAFITGLSASVVRSVVMFTIICIGQYLNRDTNIYNSLAISMLVLLIANPYLIFDAGFQLSYLAVFFIVWLQPFYEQYRLSKYRGINYMSDTVLVSLAAQIGVLPLSLYYFNRFPLLFLIANLVVIPLSNAVLVVGLLVLLLNFIWTDAALLTGNLLEGLITIMNGFISWIASFKSLVFTEIPFTLLLTLLLYMSIAFLGLWLYKKSYKRTAALLCSVLLFQFGYSLTVWNHRNGKEFIVFNNRKNTTLISKKTGQIEVMSNDTLLRNSLAISAYSRANFNPQVNYVPLQNILWYDGKKILLIDREALYNTTLKPDILVLADSPKINLERLISQLQPKAIVADGTNYKNSIKLWEATCKKQKIPFHATAKKGFYSIQ